MYRFISQPAVLVGLCLVIGLTVAAPAQADTLPVAGAAMWFDGDAITGVANGGSLSSWIDSSANGVDASTKVGSGTVMYVGATSDYAKTYTNGHAFVAFPGSATPTYLKTANIADPKLLGDLTTTVFLVASPPGNGAGLYGWGNASTGGAAFGLTYGVYPGSNEYELQCAGAKAAPFGAATTGMQITELTKSSGAINATTSFLLNGTSQTMGTASGATPTVTSDGLSIGAWANSGSDFTGGWIAELIVYDRVLTSAEAGNVGAYLQTKYGISGGYVATPEPGTFVLLATGLIGLICYAWRKRR